MPRLPQDTVLAAIDVGTNAVKLELARPLPDGSLESLHQERDPVRPGEGVFKSGRIPQEVVDRLLATLRRYGALCRRTRRGCGRWPPARCGRRRTRTRLSSARGRRPASPWRSSPAARRRG